MAAKNTKQNILDTALLLFSQKGYTAVSVRDISGKVGIKESTIYYHFKNKRAILEHLISEFKATAEKMNQFLLAGMKTANPEDMNDYFFVRTSIIYYSEFLGKEKIRQFVRMMMIEQHNDPQIALLYHELMFQQPLDQQTAYISLLIKWGYLKVMSAREMATVYQSLVYFCFSRQLAMGTGRKQAEDELQQHLTFFLAQFKREDRG